MEMAPWPTFWKVLFSMRAPRTCTRMPRLRLLRTMLFLKVNFAVPETLVTTHLFQSVPALSRSLTLTVKLLPLASHETTVKACRSVKSSEPYTSSVSPSLGVGMMPVFCVIVIVRSTESVLPREYQ